MSRGHGKIERHILGTLAKYPIFNERRVGVDALARGYAAEKRWQEDRDPSTSALSSIRRGLRNLKEAGKVDSAPNTGGTCWFISNAFLATAYHEAGHAVIARKLGVPIAFATVKPGEDHLGFVKPSGKPMTKQQHAKEVLWTLAGRIALTRAVSKKQVGLWDCGHGAREDNKHVSFHISAIIGEKTKKGFVAWRPEIQRYRKEAVKEAEKLVRKHWAAIEDVAAELIERTTLTGDEIDARIAKTERGDRYVTPFFRKDEF